MGSFVFLLFMALTIFFTVAINWKLPETKNKTFEEITMMLNRTKLVSGKRKICIADLDAKQIDSI